MRFLKSGLRLWITITSMLSFLVGWVMLAHAPKPAPLTIPSHAAAPLPTMEPLKPFSGFGHDDDRFPNAPLFGFQSRNESRPFFSTGGS